MCKYFIFKITVLVLNSFDYFFTKRVHLCFARVSLNFILSHKVFTGINLKTICLKELLEHISVAVNVVTLC
jgi:hypothetical protein